MTLAGLVAEAIGVPDWAPRLIKRAARGIIVFAAVLMPVTFQHGVTLWLNQETQQVMRQIQPLLTDMMKKAEPSRAPGGREVKRRTSMVSSGTIENQPHR